MTTSLTASEVLDRQFLEIRAKILEIAACLDRLERASGDVSQDVRSTQVYEALSVLQQRRTDRAEQIQLAFSLPYEDDWRERFGI
jgi:hypothetical protein